MGEAKAGEPSRARGSSTVDNAGREERGLSFGNVQHYIRSNALQSTYIKSATASSARIEVASVRDEGDHY